MRIWAACLALGLLAAPALAQGTDPSSDARAAAAALDEAAAALAAAESARNRVKALTGVIRAYERGLEAMREGMRRAALREEVLAAQLRAREDEIAQLLGVLQAMGHAPVPVLMLHPSGPVGTARAGMILSEVAPALDARALDLRARVQDIAVLRALQQSAANTLEEGLRGVQEARVRLSQAIAARGDLPRRFTEDPIQTALRHRLVRDARGLCRRSEQVSPWARWRAACPISGRARAACPCPSRG